MPKKKKPEDAKASAPEPPRKARKKREIYAEGHKRKFLVVVDETPECENALAFAASRAQRTGGRLALLYVVEPGLEFQHWLGIEEVSSIWCRRRSCARASRPTRSWC